MDTGIPRTRCLGFLIYGAWRREDMFERLRLIELISMKCQITHYNLLIREGRCGEDRSTDLQNHTCSWHTRKLANGLRLPESRHLRA